MMRKIFFLLTLFLAVGLSAFTQNVTFKASAPQTVTTGQQFRLTYTLNTDGSKDIRIPEFSGIQVLAGPYESISSSASFINGQATTSYSIQYTYTLLAEKEGTYDIPPATIKVKNSEYKSNSLKITVVQGNASGQKNQDPEEGTTGSQTISSEDIFVKMHISKSSAYENEGLVVTFKLYSLYDVAGYDNLKFPDFEGFIVQDIELPEQKQLSIEPYNGRTYRTLVLKQSVLYPQRAGKIKIDPGKYDFIIRVKSQHRMGSVFDNPFIYSNINKVLTSAGTSIDVKPLPSGKPASFTGAVGDYKMTSSINSEQVKSNESVTIKLNISGNGNLKLITNPEIAFPSDFEVYDPKVDLNIKASAGGVVGSKSIEYLAIPRFAGNFNIPSAEFSYFDPNSGTYKTLKTEEYHLQVEKGEEGSGGAPILSGGANKEDLKLLGSDIRYIKTNDFSFNKSKTYFFGSIGFILAYVIPIVLFSVFFIIYRKQARENANIALVRTKKANKVASKRLKLAGKLLKENKKEAFYDETLKALWGYLSDKLSIPVASLTKDNVETELEKYGVEVSLVEEFMNILNTCEFARFAPAQDSHEMDKLYESTVQAIDKMENTIKK